MSASKLLIHKFEAVGVNFKSLHITIQDEESSNASVKYGEWLEGKTLTKKSDSDKSAHLVVKISSGNENDAFNLNENAKEIDSGPYLSNILAESSQHYQAVICNKIGDKRCDQLLSYNEESKSFMLGNNQNLLLRSNIYDLELKLRNEGPGKYSNPLEYSLQKVNENNARILENIHLLNRTLNYTKKKEILDLALPKPMRSYPCNTCGKCFVFETGLRRHFAMRHAVTESQPRWQVVWTCIQCFQVWPRQDQALQHSEECCNTNNNDCVREIKTSSLLQCEFCEKVFTSIPRLLRHSKMHSTANNYECNICKVTFSSYKLAEQHWGTCPWLKTCYSFSMPKLLLCNACDRKFRNYDQLYNHRYKVGHFMTKTHCNQGSSKTLGMLVYQCEVCGQWYPSIAPLLLHKTKLHPKHEIGIQCRQDNYAVGQKYITDDSEFYGAQDDEQE